MYKIIYIMLCMVFVAGCVEPFTAGVATGVTATYGLAQVAQKEADSVLEQAEQTKTEAIATLDSLEAKKSEIDAIIATLDDDKVKEYLQNLADPELQAKVEKLQNTDWKDPKVLTGYGFGLLSLITAGYQKYQRAKEKSV